MLFHGRAQRKAIKFNHSLDHLPTGLREIRFDGVSLNTFWSSPSATRDTTAAPPSRIICSLHEKNGILVELKRKKYQAIYSNDRSNYNQPFESIPFTLRLLVLGEYYRHSLEFPSTGSGNLARLQARATFTTTKKTEDKERYEGMVWCGVVWCGVVWCGVVWCGVAWRGVARWSGVRWSGVR